MPVPNPISIKSLGCRVLTCVHLTSFPGDGIVHTDFRAVDPSLACLFQFHSPRIPMEVTINQLFLVLILNQNLLPHLFCSLVIFSIIGLQNSLSHLPYDTVLRYLRLSQTFSSPSIMFSITTIILSKVLFQNSCLPVP